MISLTPIDERIQKRLFQKMELLGNKKNIPNTSGGQSISPQQMHNKTTFIRMSSVLKNPVVLMGGELTYGTTDSDGFGVAGSQRLAAGYDEIYGPRVVQKPDDYDFFDDTTNTENKFKRPIPGVKSIDVEFKGGQKALREATISWTCWSFEDITRLTPHFLTPGTQVLLEWGWVYNEHSLKNLPTLRDLIGDNDIKDIVYQNYQDIVLENNGDFDFTVGIVKNYEYTTREDGAFDCQTTVTSIGTSIFSTPQPNKQTENTSIILKRRRLREVTNINSDVDTVLSFDIASTFKFFINHFKTYISNDIFDENTLEKKEKIIGPIPLRKIKDPNSTDFTGDMFRTDAYYVRKNAYIYKTEQIEKKTGFLSSKTFAKTTVWVRWGWFEDNILSKFISLVRKNTTKKDPVIFHRSIEKKADGKFESVRIRNHKYLETVNINKYILPGKLKTFRPEKNQILNTQDNFGQKMTFEDKIIYEDDGTRDIGDSKDIVELSKLVNNKDYFSPFDTEKEDEGYLRNMLINYDVLKRSFANIIDSAESGVESLNLQEAFDTMFTELNSDIMFWNFELTADEEDSRRTKIIDSSITAVDLNNIKKVNSSTEGKNGTKSVYNSTTNQVTNNGTFFFPVWRTNSIVKSQNVTVTIPDSLKLSIMYGNRYDVEENNNNPAPEFTDYPTLILGKLTIEELDKHDDLSLATRAMLYDLFGAPEEKELGKTPEESEISNLSAKGGTDNVRSFLEKNVKLLKTSYEEKLEQINNQLNSEIYGKPEAQTNLDPSVSYPTPDYFYKNYPNDFASIFFDKDNQFEINNIYAKKFNENGTMRGQFIDSISDMTSLTNSGNASSKKQSQIIPFDLELEIDGIGGILPFNSFHSMYLPKTYQEKTIFQIFNVGHKVDSTGWTVTLSGKMRTTLDKVGLGTETSIRIDKELEKILGREAVDLQKVRDNITKGAMVDETVATGGQEEFTVNIPRDDLTGFAVKEK